MSRIGNKAVVIPQGTTVTVNNNLVTVKGPKGELSQQFKNDIIIKVEGNLVHTSLPEHPTLFAPVYHGTVRAEIHNMVKGVSEGFAIALEIKGTGYRASISGKNLTVIAGYSNPVVVVVPEGLTVEVPQQNDIIVKGADKQRVGEFACYIRGIRPPEPYLGKGIRYKGENVRRKEGKTAK